MKPPLAMALLCAVAFAVSCYEVSDSDLFWHLKAGQDLLARGELPREDTYATSSLGRPWANGHVLFQLGVARLHALGGLRAVVLAKSCLFAGAALLLGLVLARQRVSVLAVGWAMALIALSRPLLLERPVALSLGLTLACLLCLERFVESRRWQWLVPLPALCAVWTWCQPLWPLGPAVVLAYLVGQGLRRDKDGVLTLTAALVASSVACLLGPYGRRGLSLPFVHLLRIGEVDDSVFSANVSENLPLLELLRTGDTSLRAVPVVAALTLALVLFRRRPVEWARLAVLGAFFALSLIANRNALFFYWAAALFGGLRLTELAYPLEIRRAATRNAALVLVVGVGAAIVAWLAPVWPTMAQLGRPRPFLAPETGAPLLAQLPDGARVFASVRYGSALVYATAPRVRPYIDGRLVLRSAAQFEEYLRAVDDPRTFPALAERHGFDAALLPVAGPERYQGLIAFLAAHPDWSLAHTDGLEVLFFHRRHGRFAVDLTNDTVVARLEADLLHRFGEGTDEAREAQTRLGWLLSLLGHENEAQTVLGQVDTPKAHALLAASHYRLLDHGAAKRSALRLLEADGEDANALVLLGQLALDEHDPERAEALVKRAAAAAPHDRRVESLAQRVAGTRSAPSPEQDP